MSDTTKIAAPAKSCVQLGYERGALCDDAADCARNGCAKTRQAFGCIQELQGSKKCLVSCGAGLCAATRAPKAAPAPDADGLVRRLRQNPWHGMCDEAAALIEQQARELAELRAVERDWGSILHDLTCTHDAHAQTLQRAERAESALASARAAIAAADADAARYRFLRMSPTQLGWDADYRPDEVDAAIDAARAAMGDGNG